MKIDHLGIAVRSLGEAVRFYEEALGLAVSGTREVASESVRVAFLPAGEPRIELLEPTGEGSPIARHIERRGEGLHHVCFEVEDLEAAVERLRSAGATLVEPAIREGAEGSRVAFVHPRSSHGLLVELRETARGQARSLAPGAMVVLYLLDPPAKVWGKLISVSEAGVVHHGVDLRSFDDLLRGASSGELGPRDLTVAFYPLRRVEKMLLDTGTEAAPSLQDRFLARVGRSAEGFFSS